MSFGYQMLGFGAHIQGSTTLFYDTFTDTDNTAIADHTPDIDTLGNGWTFVSGNGIKIVSNRIQRGGSGLSYATIDVGETDVHMQMKYTASSPNSEKIGLILRWQDATHYWRFWPDDTKYRLLEENAGTIERINVSKTMAADTEYTLNIKVVGDTFSIWVDDDTPSVYVSSLFNTETTHGLRVNDGTGLSSGDDLTVVTPPFDPTDVPNLLLWLDSADLNTLWKESTRTTQVSANADEVGAWDDKSGNGNHFINAAAGKLPSYRTDFNTDQSGILFDGVDQYLEGNPDMSEIAGDWTMFFVIDYTGGTREYIIDWDLVMYTGIDTSGGFGYRCTFDGWQVHATVPSSPTIATMRLDSATSTSGTVELNRTETVADSYTQTAMGGATAIGARNDKINRFWTGHISSVLIYSGNVAEADITSIEDYLAARYNITL